MEPRAHVIHRTRGRVRLRVRERRKDPAYFDMVRERLETLAGVAAIGVNPVTGCILLEHPDRPWDELMPELRRLRLFELVEEPEPVRPAIEPLLAGISRFDRTLTEESSGLLDLKTLAYVGLMVFSIRQILQGHVLGPALPMLWNAMSLAGRFHSLAPDDDS
jgi:hypothetical protein